MRILFLVDCYLPSEKSAARLACDLAQEFVRQDHHITVLTPSDTIANSITEEDENGVHVIRFKVGKIKGANLFTRAINEMSLSFVAWFRCGSMLKRETYDLIVFYSPTIFFGPLVAWLKWRTNAKTYLILRDIFPDWAVDTGIMKKGLVYWVFKGFECLQYKFADRIGVETSGSSHYFKGTTNESKIELLRNWTTLDPPPQPTGQFRKELGLEGKTVFFYGGNIGVAQDMDNILRLAKNMESEKQAHFLLVGDGSEVPRITKKIVQENIRNVTLHPPVDQETYFAMLAEFDVGLISLDRRLKTYSTTGKILGYMKCGIPILASHNPKNDLEDLLNRSGAGLASINGNDKSLYSNAKKLCDDKLRKTMGGDAAKLMISHFSVEAAVKQICYPYFQGSAPLKMSQRE